MNPHDPRRRDLLDDLLSSGSIRHAPSLHDVLATVQRAKRSRAALRCWVAAGASGMILAILFALLRSEPRASTHSISLIAATETPAPPLPAEAKPAHFEIERVDDEGLLDLLADIPTALVQWPDGRQALMLVVHAPAPQ